jgi:HlyD family secretion protein
MKGAFHVMKRFAVLTLGIIGAGAAYATFGTDVPVNLATVVRAEVTYGPVTETVHTQGTLEPLRRVNVGSQVSGTVKEIYADFNSVVRAGQVLAEIDTSLLEVQVAIQEANVARQKSDVANQEVQLEDQRRRLDRATRLHEAGLQSREQLEAAVLAVRSREMQIITAKKQLIQAEANLQAAQLNVTYATIRSPIDGVVVQRRVDRGQTVQASMSTPSFFMLVTPLQLMKLTAYVDEADIGRVRPGMPVRFKVGTYGDELFDGTVEAVRLNAFRSNEVVTYPVWIHVPNDDLRLRPSMTAEVFINVSQTGEVKRIPNDALRFRPSRAMYTALGAPAPDDAPIRAVDRQGDRVADPTALRDIAVDVEADSIDELFSPLPRADSRATVWTWDDTARRFAAIPVRVGVSDGNTTELLEGDIEIGDELVTGVNIPVALTPRPANNPLLSSPRGGRGR